MSSYFHFFLELSTFRIIKAIQTCIFECVKYFTKRYAECELVRQQIANSKIG